jgi:CHAD domain-containing protein
MAFRIEEDERLPHGIRRVACEQVDRAIASLTPPIADQEKAIHDVRKQFKKLRAILRLMRDELGDDLYRSENRFFRDLARKLSGHRDVTSLIESLDRLAKKGEGKGAAVAAAVRDRLAAEQKSAEADEQSQTLAEVREALADACSRIGEWPLERNRFAAIDRSLKRIYRNGRRAFSESNSEPSVKNLHEWRKEVKYLWYCGRILEPMWPEVFEAMVHELHQVADDLGDDHDLAMMRQLLHDREDLADDPEDRGLLIHLIDEERSRLQELAKARGSRIYSERPKTFIKRMRTYWKAWHTEGRPLG